MNGFEVQITPSKLHLFQREVEFVSRVYWKDSLIATYGERDNDLITAAVTVNFPCFGNEYRMVGYVNHKDDLTVAPLHLEQVLDMNERIKSRICDLLGKRQSRNETWVLVDADGQLLCCGPAGAKKYDVDRYHLDIAATWLKQVDSLMNRSWGMAVTVIPLIDYMAAVHASIRQHGFVTKSMRDSMEVQCDGLQMTYFHALSALQSVPSEDPRDLDTPVTLDVTDADRAVAAAAIDFIRGWTPDALSDFQTLLYKAAGENVLQTGIEGAAAFAVVEYLQYQSQFVGEVGTWMELHLRPILRAELKKSALYKMLDENGNVLTWFSVNDYDEWLVPGVYRVYIKQHETYQGVEQTVVNVEAHDPDRRLWTYEVAERDEGWRFIIKDKNGRRVKSTSYWYPSEEFARKIAQERIEKGY